MFRQKLVCYTVLGVYLSRNKNLTHIFVILLDEYTHGNNVYSSHGSALDPEHAVRALRQTQPITQLYFGCRQLAMHIDTIMKFCPANSLFLGSCCLQFYLLAYLFVCVMLILPIIKLSCCKMQINIYSVPGEYRPAYVCQHAV